MKKFCCPRCGGSFFGTAHKWTRHPDHPGPVTREIAALRLLEGYIVTSDRNVMRGPDDANPDAILEVFTKDALTAKEYRCHSTTVGDDLKSLAKFTAENQTHTTFHGTSGPACGWFGVAEQCLVESP